MAALTADRRTNEREGSDYSFPVAATTEIFMGALVVLDASGNAEPGTTATGKVAVGRSNVYIDNTGIAAAEVVEVKAGIFNWVNSSGDPVTKAAIGDTVYVEDDQTVCATATGKSAAGVMVDIDSDGVWVETKPPVTLVSGLTAANNLSDVGTAATARANLGVDVIPMGDLLIAALDGTAVYHMVAPVAGTITNIYTALGGAALVTGDATITGSIGGVAITGGVITITQAASAIGDIDTTAPSAANVVAAGDLIEFTVGGTNSDATAFANLTLELTL